MQLPELLSQQPAPYRVRFAGLDRDVEARAGETLLACARRAGIRIGSACGGRGVCAGCVFSLLSGRADPLPDVANSASGQLRAGQWLRACLVRPASDCIVEVAPRALATGIRHHGHEPAISADGRPLGLAIDLGTSNIAAFLIDLESGVCLASSCTENPQASFGADLISRINHAIRTRDGAVELQAAAVCAITTLAGELCEASGVTPAEIADCALCGNTAMHHLLAGLPVGQLGRAPFVPATCAALDMQASELGLSLLPGARLHVMPNIGGFVGGDHVAALVATESQWSTGTSIVIDIGTNTEISLIHGGSITTASAASGPALEGGNISCGMPAAEGAIDQVRLDNGAIHIRTIGDLPPVGLCGSGVVDALAILSRAGIIDRRGYLHPGQPAVRKVGDRYRFSFAAGVTFSQDDVRAVQLAKAAIRAGIDILMREAGLAEESLERVLVGGGFGAFLDVGSAISIGLFPPLPWERFQQVGNIAGAGVRMALTSGDVRRHAVELAARCRHIELSRFPDFPKVFMSRIGL